MKITTITSMAMLLVCGMAQRDEVTFSKPGRELTYQVRMNGADVILPSRAGLDLDNRVWEMALGKRDLQQPECWMDLLTVDSVRVHRPEVFVAS